MYTKGMIAFKKIPSLTVEEFQTFQDKMFATELMQTLVARRRAEIFLAISAEEDKARPNVERMKELEREAQQLDDRRIDAETTAEIKEFIEELQGHKVLVPA